MREKHYRDRAVGMSVAALAALSGAAYAQSIEVIYTKIPSSPTSLVPGALGADGLPAETRFRAIEDVVLSPDGSLWTLRGQTQQGALLASIILEGSSITGSRLIQAGQQFPSGGISETYDLLGRGSYNTKNDFGFATQTRSGVPNPAYATVMWDGSEFTTHVHTGDAASNLLDVTGQTSGDERIGDFIDSAHLLDSGIIGAHFESLENIDASRERALMYDSVAFQQIGVSTVTRLNGVGTETWARWDEDPFHTTPDGSRWMALGKVLRDSDSDEVLVIDGRIVLQEEFTIPGSQVVAEGIENGKLAPCGDWMARGTDTAGAPWAVRNGAVVARQGGPVPDEPGQTWGNTFYGVTTNCAGNWALAGRTSASAATDDVIAVTGHGVVVREGDPVDVNGDGLFNDNAFIGRGNTALAAFALDQVVLTDTGELYFIANLRNAAGQDLNSNPAFGAPSAFLRIDLSPTCVTDMNKDGFVNGIDYDLYVGAFEAGDAEADFDGDGFITGVDFDAFVSAFEAGC